MSSGKIIKEIEYWLKIRNDLRDAKAYEMADKVRDYIEKKYHCEVWDTENCYGWTWDWGY